MNDNFFDRLEITAEKRGVSIDKLFEYLKTAYEHIYLKDEDPDAELKFIVDSENRKFEILKLLEVVDCDESKVFTFTQIHLKDAKKYDKKVAVGDKVFFPIVEKTRDKKFEIKVHAKLRDLIENEKNHNLLEKYKDAIGNDLIIGDITNTKRGVTSVDVGTCVAIIPPENKIPRESFNIGAKTIALIDKIEVVGSKFNMILTRKSKRFIEKLFEQDIEEIKEELVRIVNVARVPGIQSCVVVATDEPDINPATACIGPGGSRIKSIREWVNNERIIISEYSPNVESQFLSLFNLDILEEVSYNGHEKVMNVWVKNWDENIRLVYGARMANLRIAQEICNLFDIRLFDPTRTPKETILGEEIKTVKPTIKSKSKKTKFDQKNNDVLSKNISIDKGAFENVLTDEETNSALEDIKKATQKAEAKKITLKVEGEIETVVKKKKKDEETKDDFVAQQLGKLGSSKSKKKLDFDDEIELDDDEPDDNFDEDLYEEYDSED